jgi:hypothetical protein
MTLDHVPKKILGALKLYISRSCLLLATNMLFIYSYTVQKWRQDSSVGIQTEYGMDGRGSIPG